MLAAQKSAQAFDDDADRQQQQAAAHDEEHRLAAFVESAELLDRGGEGADQHEGARQAGEPRVAAALV